MTQEKKDKDYFVKRGGYVSKPQRIERYIRNIQESSPAVRKHLYKIREKQKDVYAKQEAEIKSGVRPTKIRHKIGRIANKFASVFASGQKKFSNKQVTRSQNRATVVENQPVYTKDKSRFFKTAWEEEKRQLYFK